MSHNQSTSNGTTLFHSQGQSRKAEATELTCNYYEKRLEEQNYNLRHVCSNSRADKNNDADPYGV